jgi:hypothetical protein
MRLEDVARLLADGVGPLLSGHRDRPLFFVNIAGGPAADSLNAILMLRKTRGEGLAGRAIVVAVLDLDARGPAFGERALRTLGADGAPLNGLDVALRRVDYDWHNASALPGILDDLGARRAICAISSEGGLFEYGLDQQISANLETLRAATPADAIVVGSVTRDDEPARLALASAGAAVRPRTLEAFDDLARRSGWRIDASIHRPFSYNLRPSGERDDREGSADRRLTLTGVATGPKLLYTPSCSAGVAGSGSERT